MDLPDIRQDSDLGQIIDAALSEDIGSGDVTTLSLVPADASIRAVVISRHAYTVSGIGVAETVFKKVDPAIECEVLVQDGRKAGKDDVILMAEGPARGILTAERTALNFMQRMTGIATLTSRFVDIARPHNVAILDTRKTTPTLRAIEKYAVLCGGGENHRIGLYDRVLIKDNHRRLWQDGDPDALDKAVECSREKFPDVKIEIEVETMAELESALRAKPDWVLLDNMGPERLREAVKICAGRSRLEASGGITLANVGGVAATGVDAISLGCLTHSAPAADLSLEIP
jgi:nicotinate-nucleotide pyrophosphorylase (carboxylating)